MVKKILSRERGLSKKISFLNTGRVAQAVEHYAENVIVGGAHPPSAIESVGKWLKPGLCKRLVSPVQIRSDSLIAGINSWRV